MGAQMINLCKSQATYDPEVKIDIAERHKNKGLLVLGGLLFCLTGLGAIIGIPMIIFGIVTKSYEKGAWKGACPKCSKDIFWYQANAETVEGDLKCPSCCIAIKFYSGEFIHTPPVGT